MPEQITPLSVLYLLLHSTFTLAFKQRMGQSVTAWMRDSGE